MAKHLTLEDRTAIQQGVQQNQSFRQIAGKLNRSLSSISREVKKHRTELSSGAFGRITNRCIHRNACKKNGLCMDKPDCTRNCAACNHCNRVCADFSEFLCPKLNVSPYVCNGCPDKSACVLRKQLYIAKSAQDAYDALLKASRTGINMTENELRTLDDFISPLLRNGQSVHHIAMTQPDTLTRSSRTIYRLIHANAISARAIDMPRVCRLRPRHALPNPFKVDKACRINRSFPDYQAFMTDHPDLPVVQMDSVIGLLGGKVLLTLHLTVFDFMIAILRDRNTARSVTDSLSQLRDVLSPDLFFRLFPVLLTDNGSEFSDPSAIEFSNGCGIATHVFYCDPCAAYQKPNVELNHEFIRRFLPKGASFEPLTQQDISLMMSHINSYARAKFGGLSPAQLLIQAYGIDTLHLLGQALIPPEKIVLNDSIFRK